MSKRIQSKKASTKDWHRADIKAALEKAGWSLRRLSLHNGYSDSAMKAALEKPYPMVERIIAGVIGVHPWEIWPSRYRSDHTPKSGRNERGLGRFKRKNDSTAQDSRNVKAGQEI